jgi:epoxyqueuosine reductase QueG
MSARDSSRALKEIARSLGADLVGIADLACLKDIDTEPADLLSGYTRAISIAVKLPGVDRPICGICIKVCPWGRTKRGKRRERT